MTLLVLSFSDIPRDPRVAKICRSLSAAGYRVVAAGYGEPERADGFVLRAIPKPTVDLGHRLGIALRQTPANLAGFLARFGYGLDPQVARLRAATADLCPALVYANDLATLPLAAAIARRHGAALVYDSHEFAIDEGADRALWRLVFRRFREVLERRHIGEAGRVITVSDGIADALQRLYGLRHRPAVIRNVPPYRPMPWREPAYPPTVLYHGAYLPDRGLETLIRAAGLWRGGAGLALRGLGDPAYEAALRRLAEAAAPGRVRFLDPVAPSALVTSAHAEADIGIIAHAITGPQMRYALPNKLFEYVMAGLAVVTTPGDDIAHLVRAGGFGIVAESATPAGFAAAVDSLDISQIGAMKRAALESARKLNWEAESRNLLGLIEELVGPADAEPRAVTEAAAALGCPSS